MDFDRPLVDAAAAGDRDAFDELVRRYRGQILSLARALRADSSPAEDIVQEIFVRAWRGVAGFRGESSFRSWLHRVAVNVISSQRRRTIRERSLFRLEAHGAMIDEVEPTSREDLETQIGIRLAIDRALAQLPFELRVAVVLRDLQGLEYKDIAQTLGIPIGTVESRIFRGRQRLRPLLQPLRAEHARLRSGVAETGKDDRC